MSSDFGPSDTRPFADMGRKKQPAPSVAESAASDLPVTGSEYNAEQLHG